MCLQCNMCRGNETVPAYYANDVKRLIRQSSKGCLCIGGPSRRMGECPREGEREVDKATAENLEAFWLKEASEHRLAA